MTSAGIYRTISEQIADQLRTEILSGQMAEGEPLPGDKLAKRFGVSRGPIRDALLQLVHEGLLVSQPNSGIKVASGPSERLRPLVVDLRRRIEEFALVNIFDQISEDDVRKWEEVLQQIKDACERRALADLVEHDLEFHRLIIERTGDEALLAIWQPIVVRMMMNYGRHAKLIESWNEHRAILEAVRVRDLEAATKALEANIQ